MMLTLLGPEFVFAIAAGQRAEAKRARNALRKMGYSEWTLRHSFYLNMGGFVVQPLDSEPFPLYRKHLVYLLREGFVVLPDITSEEISDKSKANGTVKLLVCLQTGWFVMQCLGRVKQHLALTALELTTIGLVWCTWATYTQWLEKPLDVKVPTTLRVQASTAEILSRAGLEPSQPYQRTPLDFVSKDPPSLTSQVQELLHLRVDPCQKPLARIENDVFLMFSTMTEVAICTFVIISYGAFHLCGWNLVFPTRTEGILWRVAAVVFLCSTSIYVIFILIFDVIRAARRLHVNKENIRPRCLYYTLVGDYKKAVGADGLPLEDKVFEVNVIKFLMIVISPLATLFLSSRLYLIAEALVSLRALPDGAFLNVQWATYIPHL